MTLKSAFIGVLSAFFVGFVMGFGVSLEAAKLLLFFSINPVNLKWTMAVLFAFVPYLTVYFGLWMFTDFRNSKHIFALMSLAGWFFYWWLTLK